MDAATLFVILKLTSGEERTVTKNYDTVLSCEVAAQALRDTAPPVHWDVERTVYCKPLKGALRR
jgi:hypothetical protein